MMLITLTILLPLVHTVSGMECHAESMTVNTSTLPEPILEQLEKEGGIIWDNQTFFATYYQGFPDLLKQDRNRFMAACIGGLEDRAFHHCVNATWIDGEKGGQNITVAEFLKFYNECNIEAGLNKLKKEDEDDYDKGKNEADEELEELAKAAGEVN